MCFVYLHSRFQDIFVEINPFLSSDTQHELLMSFLSLALKDDLKHVSVVLERWLSGLVTRV